MRTLQIAVATTLLVSALGTSIAIGQTEPSDAFRYEGVAAFAWEADSRRWPSSMESWLLSTAMVTGVSTGAEDAPITIVLVDLPAALDLPYYATFYRETLPKIRARYVETGLVRLVAVNADAGGSYGLGLVCADRQELGWEFNETAFTQFAPQLVGWFPVYGNIDGELLVLIAETAGLDPKRFAKCIRSIWGSIGEMGDGSGLPVRVINPLLRTVAEIGGATISVGNSDKRAFSGVLLSVPGESERAIMEWLDTQVSSLGNRGLK